VRHARGVELLVVLVLGWSMLAEATEAFSIVLDRHVHPILHVELILILLELALVTNVMGPIRPRIN